MRSPPAGSAEDSEFWPAFFREQVAANARFWAEQLAAGADAVPLLHEERANILKAIGRALQLDPASGPARDLLIVLHPVAERQGLWAEWERLLEAAVAASRRQGDAAQQAALLNRLGSLNREQGDWPAAEACHQQALNLATSAEDEQGTCRSLIDLGNLYRMQGRHRLAERFLVDGLERAHASGILNLQANAHTSLGLLYAELRDPDRALAHHQVAYAIWSAANDLLGMAQTEHNSGLAYHRRQQYEQAESHYLAALELYEQAHSRHYVAVASMDLGSVYLFQGKLSRAEELYRQAQAVMAELGNRRGLAQVANNLGMALARQREWALAEESYLRSIALWERLGNPLSQANAEDNLAEVYLSQKRWRDAEKVLVAAGKRLGDLDPTPQVTGLMAEVEAHLAAAREGMVRTA